MGYTHYWTLKRNPTSKEIEFVAKGINALLKHHDASPLTAGGYYPEEKVELFNWDGTKRVKSLTQDTVINFNGDGSKDLDHENFYLAVDSFDEAIGNKIGRPGFNFCKTERKPYDTAVVAALVLLKRAMGSDVEVKSDGNDMEWAPILKPLNKALEADKIDASFLAGGFNLNNEVFSFN